MTVLWTGQGRGETSVAGVKLNVSRVYQGSGWAVAVPVEQEKEFSELLVGGGIC